MEGQLTNVKEDLNKMDSLLNVQKDLSNSIIKGFTNFKKSPKDRITTEYVEARLENLEYDWSSFRSNNRTLYEVSDSLKLANTPYYIDDVYDTTEDNYLMYKASMKVALNKLTVFTQELNQSNSQFNTNEYKPNQLVQLPKISIPIFSGLYSEWTSFRDLFISLVDKNSSLDNVQKLHYLKSHLIGEAEQLIRHTPITDANYSQCWSLLEKRYNNKKYLANCILRRLFEQKRIQFESASALKDLLDTTMDCLNALKNMEIDISTWDIIIIHIVTFKLDPETRKQWELHICNIDSNKLPNLEQLKDFMESRFRALEFLDSKRSHQQHYTGSYNAKPKVLFSTNVLNLRCEYCSDGHKLCFCKQFAKQDCSQRRDFVLKNRICFNCLGSNHTVYDCKNPNKCRICNRHHHSLLHLEQEDKDSSLQSKDQVEGTSSSSVDNPIVSCLSTRSVPKFKQVLLATALVNAGSAFHGQHVVRALIDQGSQACFISEAAVQLLRLKKTSVTGTITGLGGDKGLTFKYAVNVHLQSRIDKNFNIQFKAYVLNNVTSYLPEQRVKSINWIEIEHMCLADPQFNTPNKIDILLGANVFTQILKEGVKKSPDGSLVAQNTTLGWILSGTINKEFIKSNQSPDNSKISVMHAHINENDMLKRFWEIEEQFTRTKTILTEEEQKCEDIFNNTTKRTPEGRYIVKLPFRDAEPRCVGGDSREIAVRKFRSLEKRLSKNIELKQSYSEVINEYIQLGHMRPVTSNNTKLDEVVYLPHHAVVKNERTTTKVRVVFNASSKNNLGVSLNDCLLVGPKLQPDLRHLILRWREHTIVLVADIVKMYRQVRVNEDDANFQRIVWRDNPEMEIRDFELVTVTFGTASAPYLAVKALNQVSYDEAPNFPLAAPRVVESFYVDDLMTGCSDIKEGIDVYKQMSELLLKGGFKLQKWNSNNMDLLSEISRLEGKSIACVPPEKGIQKNDQNLENKRAQTTLEDTEQVKNKEIDMKTDNITKVLGIAWDRSKDRFCYSVNLATKTLKPETKRSILSEIARLYDPLGWLAPSIILAKMFMQKLWLTGIAWDEPVPAEVQVEWDTYRKVLHNLTSVQIPRWLGTSSSDRTRELHGFCDASKLAYAAVVYLKVVNANGEIHVCLLAAKTRVAPIKQISIPRLELCGATLLTQLLSEIAEVMYIHKNDIRAWTDSTIVLAWLNSHPSKWKTFVANRVSEILTTLDSSQWYHVPSKDNPADCASRGIQPDVLADNELWFSGPQFLNTCNVPYNRPKDLKVDLEEAVKSHFNVMVEDTILLRFSSLSKLIRVIAYCRRFYKRNTKRTIYLSKMELDEALLCCIQKAQREDFNEEYLQLQIKDYIESKNSKLKSLNPYLDDKGVMRVSGRLQKSQLSEEVKHPIILSHNSQLTKLIIADAHHKTLHGGNQIMINYLRGVYWIIGVRKLVKHHIHKCVTCIRQNAKVQNQYMGSLPVVRCTPARPFLHSGVDYAGPIQIRTSKGRGIRSYKGYICLFVCMATRAIHLEVVSDMSTQAFIAAFRRFVSRRGHCAQIWSDNGTTFVGASKELKEIRNVQQEVAPYLEMQGTEWHFIPPHAPNFGGIWEAGIKSTKFHLKRVIGESTLTFEELITLLTQIEACLNSRPLTVDSSDPSDSRPLTPGHFLIGGPLVIIPDVTNYVDSNVNLLSRWQFIQRILQSFWRRWSQEYLSNLMNRYKWAHKVPEPNIGDVVLVKEDDMPPSRWLMGRIIEKHTGSDGITRVVTLRVKTSKIKRPTSKLCVLPTMTVD